MANLIKKMHSTEMALHYITGFETCVAFIRRNIDRISTLILISIQNVKEAKLVTSYFQIEAWFESVDCCGNYA